MSALVRRSLLACLFVFGCDAQISGEISIEPDVEPEPDFPEGQANLVPGDLQLNLLYVHGVNGCDSSRQGAHGSLADLEAAVNAALPAWIADLESRHPGVNVVVKSARANIYTATPSPFHPSDSNNPLHMDDWEAGDPGCSATRQGEPCTTAFEWRYRLVQEINRHFGPNARNIVLIGHSTGARAAFEVTANVGPNGVNTFDWGVQDRVIGVVSIQGMIDSLGTSKYNVIGAASFVNTCKYSDAILGFGDNCAMGNGWCEYASEVSAFPAADWVARNKRALMLISHGSCSPALWTGESDGSLPLDAQGSPLAVGLELTPAPGQTYRPAHGIRYGSFCHSAITNRSNASHNAAVNSARDQILSWLFENAPRVAAAGSFDTPSTYGKNASSPTFVIGTSCGAGQTDGGVQVAGICKHPGFFDGDDHKIASGEISLSDASDCTGSFRWTQKHSNNKHSARFFWKTYSLPQGGGLLETLTNL